MRKEHDHILPSRPIDEKEIPVKLRGFRAGGDQDEMNDNGGENGQVEEEQTFSEKLWIRYLRDKSHSSINSELNAGFLAGSDFSLESLDNREC